MQYHLMLVMLLSLSVRFSRTVVSQDLCEFIECKDDEDCVIEEGEPVCKEKTNEEEEKDKDPCNYIECEDDQDCVIEEGDPVCKEKMNEEEIEEDLCSQHPCENNGTCLPIDGRAECLCVEPYRGKKCELGPCDPNPCKNGGDCRVNGIGYMCICIEGRSGDTCEEDESDDTSKNPATTVSITISSTSVTTTQKTKSDTTDVSESVFEITTVTEMPKTGEPVRPSTILSNSTSAYTKNEDKITDSTKNEAEVTAGVSFKDLSTIPETTDVSESVFEITTVTEMPKTDDPVRLSTILSNSTSAFTKNEDKITESTKNEAEITAGVSLKDLSTISLEITSKTNTVDKAFTETTISSSVENTSEFDNKTIKTSLATSSIIATSISSLGSSSEENQQMINGTITDNLKTTQYTTYSAAGGNTVRTSHAYSSTTKSKMPTIQTPPYEPLQLTNRTTFDDLSTSRYTTYAKGLFQSSSQSSWHIIPESSTSASTSENISDMNLEITSEKSQTEILRSTESTKRTQTAQKSTTTVVSSTETFNSTSDKNHDPDNAINRANVSTKNATTYGSIGAACFVAIIVFTAAGWYVRRYRRRQHRSYHKGGDSSSEISTNSADSNLSYA